MKLSNTLICLIGASLLLMGSTSEAQNRNLVLETLPEATTIPITGTVRLADNGDVTITPSSPTTACSASGSCEGVEVTVTSLTSPDAINGVITLEEGEGASLVWKTLGSRSCRGAGTFAPWSERVSLPTDSRDGTAVQVAIATQVGDAAGSPYEIKLQCSNGSVVSDDTAASTLSLIVEEYVAPSPTSCEGREPLAGWQQLTTGALSCHFASGVVTSSDCRDWVSVWQGTFLQSGGKPRTLMTNVSAPKQYVAMQFTTEGMSATASGQLSVEGPPSGVLAEPIMATISRCPGDFNPSQPTGCYIKPSSIFQLTWRAPDSNAASNCVLEPDTKYYLNLISTLSPLDTKPSEIQENAACKDNRCGIQLTPRFNK